MVYLKKGARRIVQMVKQNRKYGPTTVRNIVQ